MVLQETPISKQTRVPNALNSVSANSVSTIAPSPTDGLVPIPAIDAIRTVVDQELAASVRRIDLNGEYPEAIMRHLGAAGAFQQAVSPEFGGVGVSLKGAVQSIEAVSKVCLSTGFITWCQIACTWYLQNTENQSLKTQLLSQVARGEVLAGTGLSNPMKCFAGIESMALKSTKVDGGYILNGQLPWVSNLGSGHYFGVVAKMDSANLDSLDSTDPHLMAIVSDDLEGVSLRRCGEFIALEGTGTFACVFRDAFVPDEYVLAAPCEAYVDRIRPGFILTQVGMGLGLVAGCLDLINRYQRRLGHVNCFLEVQPDTLRVELDRARQQAYQLADTLTQMSEPIPPTLMRDVVQARLTAGEMSLKAANAAMHHAGARAYLRGCPEERELREAYFVAIVTPAIKQLKKMLYALAEPA